MTAEISESYRPSYEVRHLGNLDVVINLDANQALVKAALNKIKGTFPKGWKRVSLTLDGSGNNKFYIDSDEIGPQLVAKDREIHIKKAVGWPRTASANKQPKNYDSTEYNASNSVVSEIALSPKIKDILKSARATELAREVGFEEIRYIEPLLATVNRQTGRKIVVYEFVDGAPLDYLSALEGPSSPYPDLVDGLYELFEERGIEPNDIETHQMIAARRDNSKVLYLLDTESYVDTSRSKTSSVG